MLTFFCVLFRCRLRKCVGSASWFLREITCTLTNCFGVLMDMGKIKRTLWRKWNLVNVICEEISQGWRVYFYYFSWNGTAKYKRFEWNKNFYINFFRLLLLEYLFKNRVWLTDEFLYQELRVMHGCTMSYLIYLCCARNAILKSIIQFIIARTKSWEKQVI